MARRLRPQKVDEFWHRQRGVKLDLFLDRNDNTFFFTYQDEIHWKPSIAELQQEARKVIDESVHLVWVPMITIEKLKPFARDEGNFIGFIIHRSYIAQKANGFWLTSRWDDVTSEREREEFAHDFSPGRNLKGDFKLPYYGAEQGCSDSTFYYLPYTEELWIGLEELLAKINTVREKLDELLTTPAGLDRLSTLGGHLLPATFGTPHLLGTVEMES